ATGLSKLHRGVDEPSRLADQRAGGLDRAVDAVAVELVVLAGGAEGLAAAGAGQPVPAVAVHQIQVLCDRAHHGEPRAGVRPRLAAEAFHECRMPERSRRGSVHAQVLALADYSDAEDLPRRPPSK